MTCVEWGRMEEQCYNVGDPYVLRLWIGVLHYSMLKLIIPTFFTLL